MAAQVDPCTDNGEQGGREARRLLRRPGNQLGRRPPTRSPGVVGRDFLPTLELVDLLVAHNPGCWGEDSPYGKRLTETRLGRMLNQATNSTSTRPGGKGRRGYTLSALQIAWDRLRVGQTDPDATSINPVSLENPANPERESARPEPDNAGLTEFSGCTGLQERGAGSALRAKLLPYFTAPGEQTPTTNGHAGGGLHDGDARPTPPRYDPRLAGRRSGTVPRS